MAYSHRTPDGATINRFQYQATPESRLSQIQWINTEGVHPFRLQDARVETVNLYGTELLLIYGSFSLQGEYIRSNVDTTFDGRETFDGYYASLSYFLTGETRAYQNNTGLFDRIQPKNNFGWHKGLGAWELAARYSTIDLNSNGVRGGEENNWTLGVNWYLNPNTRWMLNYTLAQIEHDLYEGDFNILQTRFQFDF